MKISLRYPSTRKLISLIKFTELSLPFIQGFQLFNSIDFISVYLCSKSLPVNLCCVMLITHFGFRLAHFTIENPWVQYEFCQLLRKYCDPCKNMSYQGLQIPDIISAESNVVTNIKENEENQFLSSTNIFRGPQGGPNLN